MLRLFPFSSLRRLSENALFPKLCVMLKKLSSKYQLYVCGNFFEQALILKKIAIIGQPPKVQQRHETTGTPEPCKI